MDNCPNCETELEMVDFYQDPVVFGEFYQTWHYVCPNCGKKYAYTEYFRLYNHEIEEEE